MEKDVGLLEVTLHVRNALGEPTGKRIHFASGNGHALAGWYEKNKYKPPRKRKKRKNKA